MFLKITNNFFNNSFYFPFKDLSVWSFIIKKIQKKKRKKQKQKNIKPKKKKTKNKKKQPQNSSGGPQ